MKYVSIFLLYKKIHYCFIKKFMNFKKFIIALLKNLWISVKNIWILFLLGGGVSL